MKTYSVICIAICMVLTPVTTIAQIPINSVSTVSTVVVSGGTASQSIAAHSGSVNGVLPSTSYTVGYNNTGNVDIVGFSMSGKSYVRFSYFDTVILRRVSNAWETTGGNKQHIYCQGPSSIDNVTFKMNFPIAFPQVSGYSYMERVMKEGYINRGSDNVFNNDAGSDLTHNNIERVDFVYKTGIATTGLTSAGFVIAERGGNDPFKIAAITGIDVNGNPTSFGPVLSVAASAYGSVIMNASTYVMRKDAGDNALRPFSLVPTQAIKSVFIRFSDLGITAMQKVYGYALMGNDVTATTSAQLLNYTNNTYFPRTTTNADGGMDMASAPGIFHTDLILDVKFLDLTTQNKNCEQFIQWKDDDYQKVREYQVEKSLDRENFEKLAIVEAGQSALYNYTDKSFKASSYYRIKAILLNGNYYYSSIIFAANTCSAGSVTLYPNPVQDKVNINFGGLVKTNQISIISADGKECGRWAVNSNTQALQLDISRLPRGQYFIKFIDMNSMQKTYPIIKQ
ncbi:MAG: T9SS type A sorting domain-containing protein [Chitinophagaceae bacterium]|nr:T9SS type A sorting domain-containing protein [Chitinophagaceae bacterium]